MEQTINIGGKDVKLNNNIGWALNYRDQFGQDIIPAIMPMLSGALDILGGIIDETDKSGEIEISDLLKVIQSDSMTDAVVHLSAVELVDLINITWALAKTADDSIPEPRLWVKDFEDFPVDVVAPAVFNLVASGVVSTKNLERLKIRAKEIQPLNLTTSFYQESSGD